MTATVFVQLTVKDGERMQEYASGAGPTVQAQGGAIVGRFGIEEVLAGSCEHQRLLMLEFPSVEAARGWYNSAEYQALIPTREAAADALFILASPAG